MSTQCLNTIGLFFDIVGVFGIFYFALQGKQTEQTPVKLYKVLAKISLGFALSGFALQIIASQISIKTMSCIHNCCCY